MPKLGEYRRAQRSTRDNARLAATRPWPTRARPWVGSWGIRYSSSDLGEPVPEWPPTVGRGRPAPDREKSNRSSGLGRERAPRGKDASSTPSRNPERAPASPASSASLPKPGSRPPAYRRTKAAADSAGRPGSHCKRREVRGPARRTTAWATQRSPAARSCRAGPAKLARVTHRQQFLYLPERTSSWFVFATFHGPSRRPRAPRRRSALIPPKPTREQRRHGNGAPSATVSAVLGTRQRRRGRRVRSGCGVDRGWSTGRDPPWCRTARTA